MSSYDKSFPVSWEEIHRNSKALAWRLHDISSFKGIIAVTRGGLVPAAIVARELDMRLIDTVCVSSYKEKSRSDVEFLKNKTFTFFPSNFISVPNRAPSPLLDLFSCSVVMLRYLFHIYLSTLQLKLNKRLFL